MSEVRFPRVLPEPAHEAIKRHDDLFRLYSHIREKYQLQIDRIFDRTAQQIGFVVATALPFSFEIADNQVKQVMLADGNLQGTLFEEGFGKLLQVLADDPVPVVQGTYRLYLFWYDALKLKLRTDWMEPVHHRARWRFERPQREIIWESREPPHWFDPRIALSAEESVLLSVIDEVYPELRLAERVSQYRHGLADLPDMPAAPG